MQKKRRMPSPRKVVVVGIRVLFFGATADVVGERELMVDGAARTVAEVRDMIVGRHPKLAVHKLLLAVNQEYSLDDRRLIDGDELAIFTAVSGG